MSLIKSYASKANISGASELRFDFYNAHGYITSAYYVPNGTSNCQMSNIYPFQTLIGADLSKKDLYDLIKEAQKKVGSGSKLLYFDIKDYYLGHLKKYWPKPVSISEYISTNGSRMHIGIVNINDLA